MAPTAPKIGASTGGNTSTMSCTSAKVKSANCLGIGNPAFSYGNCSSSLYRDCFWSTPTNNPDTKTREEQIQSCIRPKMLHICLVCRNQSGHGPNGSEFLYTCQRTLYGECSIWLQEATMSTWIAKRPARIWVGKLLRLKLHRTK